MNGDFFIDEGFELLLVRGTFAFGRVVGMGEGEVSGIVENILLEDVWVGDFSYA